MVDIEKITPEIIEALKPLDPDKIILFGSYAYGTPNKDSDIDLFLLKEGLKENMLRNYSREARLNLFKLLEKYNIAFDVVTRTKEFLENRKDYFYNIDILKKGKILYAK